MSTVKTPWKESLGDLPFTLEYFQGSMWEGVELQAKGENQSFEEVLQDIRDRDHNDMTRELNPLRKAEDAIELDTTGLNIDQVVEEVLKIVRG